MMLSAMSEIEIDASTSGPAAAGSVSRTKSPPPPVLSLVDLYMVKGASPARLLRELDKAPSWRFDEADVDGALELLGERDTHLQRTRRLLHEGIGSHEGKFARAAIEFALRAMAADLHGVASWPPEEGADPIGALKTVARHLAPQMGDPGRRKRAHNILMMSADLLSHRHGLVFEDAAPVLREVLGRPTEYEGPRSNPRRHRMASLTDARNDLDRVRDLLDLVEPWEVEIRASKDAAKDASVRAEKSERRATATEARAEEATLDLERLREELETLRQEASAFSDQARDVRIVASSDVTELRSRMLAFLNTRLRDLLVTAREASEVDPPRTATALRLIQQAIAELQKEAEWLRSSA
jgi:hypothetical protein